MTRGVLMVEGPTDERFFEVLTAPITGIEIFPPKKSGGTANGIDALLGNSEKEGAIRLQLNRIKQGAISRLGIIIDADSESSTFAGGFNNRYRTVADILSTEGFTDISDSNEKGFIFKRDDANDIFIGLWIMPDCQNPGIFEDLLLECINHKKTEHHEIFGVSQNSVNSIKNSPHLSVVRFRDAHESKVRFSTWLQWLRQPNHCYSLSPACALKEGWLNPDHDNIKALTSWLTRVFQ